MTQTRILYTSMVSIAEKRSRGPWKVQRRTTKMIDGFRHKTYEERLSETGLTTLVQRRKRGDLIETFKLIKGIPHVDYTNFFTINENMGRGHMYEFVKNRSRLNVRAHFFSQRVVNDWNKLPTNVVNADMVNSFKNRLDAIKFWQYRLTISWYEVSGTSNWLHSAIWPSKPV